MLKNINNSTYIDDRDIYILEKYGININDCHTIRDIQIKIERVIALNTLEDEEIDELDYLEERLQEGHYYTETKK